MADFNNDQLLLALGIDLSPLKNAATQAESILDALEEHWNQVNKKGASGATEQAQATTAVAAASQKVKDAISQVVAQTNAAVEATKSQVSTQQLNVDILHQQINEATLLTKQSESQAAAYKAQTAQLQMQTAEMRKQRAAQAGEGSTKEGGTAATARLLTGFTKGALGENVFGQVAAGVLAGEGISSAIEGASHALEEFISHLRELSVESGSVVQLQAVFNRMAQTMGTSGTALLGNLKASTEGLADNFTLMRTGLMALTSSYQISIPVLQQFLHDTVNVAEASGVSATHALDALRQAFTLGRPQVLSAALGMESFRNITAQLPPVIQGAARQAATFNIIMREVHERAMAFGELPPTLEKTAEQFEVIKKNLDLAFGTGFNESEGINQFTKALDQISSKESALTKDAQHFGEVVGDAVGIAAEGLSKLVGVMSSIPAQFVAWAAGAGLVGLFGSAVLGAVKAVVKHTLAQTETAGVTVEATAAEAANAETLVAEGAAANEAAASLGRAAGASAEAGVAAEGMAASTGSAGLATVGLGGALRGLISAGPAVAVALVPISLVLAAIGLSIELVEEKAEGMFGKLPTMGELWRGSLDQMRQNWNDIWSDMSADLEAALHGHLGQLLNQVGAQIGNFSPSAQMHQTAANVAGEQRSDQTDAAAAKGTAVQAYETAKIKYEDLAKMAGSASKAADVAYMKTLSAKGASALAEATKKFQAAQKIAEYAAKQEGAAHTDLRTKAKTAGISDDEMASTEQMAAYIKMQQDRAGDLTPGQQSQITKSMAAAMQERAQAQLEAKKQTIAQEKEMDDEAYAAGEEDFAKHQEQMQQIADKTRDAQLEENKQSYNIGITSVNQREAQGTELPGVAAYDRESLLEKKNKADEAAETAHNIAMFKIRMDGVKDAEKAATEEAATVLNTKQKQYQTELALAKTQFEQGQLSAQGYIIAQIQEQQKLANAQIEKAGTIYAAGPKNQGTQATYIKETSAAIADAQSKITEIFDQQTSLQLQAIERVYTVQQKAIDAQLAFNKQFGGGMPVGGVDQSQLLERGIDSVTQQIQAYEGTFEQMNANGEQFSDNWWKVVDGTQAAMTKLIEYNDQLAETQAMSTPVGNIFETLGKGIQNSLGNPKAKNAGMVIASAGQQLANLAQVQQQMQRLQKGTPLDPVEKQMLDMSTRASTAMSGVGDTFKDSTTQVENALKQLADAISDVRSKIAGQSGSAAGTSSQASGPGPWADANTPNILGTGDNDWAATGTSSAQDVINAQQNVAVEEPIFQGVIANPSTLPSAAYGSGGNGINNATDPMNQFAAKLQLAVQGLTSFVSTITQAQTPLAGAIGGGISGGSLGSEAQSSLSNVSGGIGDAMQGALGQAMPFIGAAVGMLLGGIMGQKNAEIQEEIQDLKTAFTNMQQAFSSGNQTLQQTVTQLQGLIAAAEQDEANSKKGAQQFQDLVNQYNQQLTQYLDQQQQLMIQLNQATGQLSLPNFGADYSSYISSLQQMVSQYEQYAGAATTATQQLQAQQFLQQSINNYAQQWTEQLEQDEITQVQNALQLNELITQRNQLLQQTAQNERNIMEQGVLTRQQTFAQSKAQQLAQTQLSASLQLEQMNQQIDVAQAQVSAAQQVFDLATTRIGLEQQLINLQSAAADRSMQGVAALANLVAALNSGVPSNNSAVPTQNDFIVQLLSMLAGSSGANASALVGLLSIFQQYSSSGLSSGTILSTY